MSINKIIRSYFRSIHSCYLFHIRYIIYKVRSSDVITILMFQFCLKMIVYFLLSYKNCLLKILFLKLIFFCLNRYFNILFLVQKRIETLMCWLISLIYWHLYDKTIYLQPFFNFHWFSFSVLIEYDKTIYNYFTNFSNNTF